MATIYHPVLDRTSEVPDSTVEIWERSGWQPYEPPTHSPAPPADDPDPDPDNPED